MLKSSILFLVLIPLSTFGQSFVQKETCVRTGSNEKILKSSEFSWGMSLSDIKSKEKDVYERGLRLKERAYLENGVVYLPYTPYGGEEQKVKLSERF